MTNLFQRQRRVHVRNSVELIRSVYETYTETGVNVLPFL